MSTKIQLLALLVILSIAFWLRFQNLGALGLYGDEDHTYLAVKGILETGLPSMPSGVIYIRGIIHTYLSSLSASIFGLSEFSIRLPSVVFGLLVILLLYIIGKEIFGQRTALVTCSVYAVSAWDIEMSRFARMYEPFIFFCLMSTFAFYKGFIQGKRNYRILTAFLFVLTTTIHLLGVFLVPLFLIPFVLKDCSVLNKKNLIIYAGVIGFLDLGWMEVEKYIYRQILAPVLLLSEVRAPIDKSIADLSLVSGLFSVWRWENALFGLIIILLCIGFVRYVIKNKPISILDMFVSGILIVGVLLQQYGIAFWIFAFALFITHKGFGGVQKQPNRAYALFLIISFVLWFAWGIYNGMNHLPAAQGLGIGKKVLLTIVDYPFITLRYFVYIMPIMTILVLAGLLVLFDRASKNSRNGAGCLILMVGLLGPLMGVGFFKKWPYSQYLYMTYPFFVLIYVWFIGEMIGYTYSMVEKQINLGKLREWAVLCSVFALAFILTDYHSFNEAKLISQRGYGSMVEDVKIFEYNTHPDHKNAALFVKRNIKPHDIVIAMDALMTYIYLERVNYILRTEGILTEGLQMTKEIFTGTPVIRDLRTLEKIVQDGEGSNVWLITSHELMGPHLKRAILSEEVRRFLDKNIQRVVYTAEDGVTRVYLWRMERGDRS